MRKFRVIEDCTCAYYLHEITNYPRPGLVEKKLSSGDVVNFIDDWKNFYGSYFRVCKDGDDYEYDIPKNKLQEIWED